MRDGTPPLVNEPHAHIRPVFGEYYGDSNYM
jgi:hypothetical protein